MSYTNVTTLASIPVKALFDWVEHQPKTFLNAHVLRRGAHFAVAPIAVIASAVDTTLGLGLGLAALCTLGKHQPTLEVAIRHLSHTTDLFSRPYAHILWTINPQAKLSKGIEKRNSLVFKILDRNIVKPLDSLTQTYRTSQNLRERQVATRLTIGLQAVCFVIGRLAEAIISVPALCLSILTVGKFKPLNNFAYTALRVPSIIREVFFFTILGLHTNANPADWDEVVL